MSGAVPPLYSVRANFEKGIDIYNDLEDGKVTAKDVELMKSTVGEGIRSFMTAKLLVSQNDLFSENETLDDIKTSSLKYLSISFYLGELYQRVPNYREFVERVKTLKQALKCYKDFLDTCVHFVLVKPDIIVAIKRTGPVDDETNRAEKIARFRREKVIKDRLAALFRMKVERAPTASLADLELDDDLEDMEEEDEDERELRLMLLEQNALKALDHMKSLESEIGILSHMAGLMKDNNGKLPPRAPPPADAKPPPPLVIKNLRQEVKNTAFRPGWNQATVSIEEANFVDGMEAMERHQKEKAQEAQEKYIEEWGDNDLDKEDPNEVYKEREMDEFKDDNPRGSGNTGTKGYAYA
eukprot:TRINITY_DN3703_c0_g1_i1.p1 TRINITY_DN3703_c0_g1~~TRINITY_DN3703_c0_g1_i1.p1  ORF type:complete len:389 (+),score=124.41 TRINITY_DN3703_c0_g1_i1:107-1168(+)